MSTSDAWLLECGEALSIAVGDHEMVELLQTESFHHEPGTPPHCSDVLQWHEKIVPIVDIEVLHDNVCRERSALYLCLLNYQEAPDKPLQQLALKVDRAPERIQVDDAKICELPRDFDDSPLKPAILSCFTHHAKPVLILDISSLSSPEIRDLASIS